MTRLSHVCLMLVLPLAWQGDVHAAEKVRLDDDGVVRWIADDREVALFGANYCLPSASDYRAAGYVGADRRRLIEQDMAHFARLGWDGLRVALWGDWENSDRDGNLIENEHLDLMDYLIHQAKLRGISMLFTPIHTHSALWPDGGDAPTTQGFSRHIPRDQMGRDQAAIAVQQNYLRQILRHVNPYTGVALKDEPAILFVELINEPWHHADDHAGSVAYINALVDAVRDTGCEKILFHNLSQDFDMAPAIKASRADGFSFGWYPTGLLARRTLTGNFLRWVDDYPPLDDPVLQGMPRIVYEFDSADSLSPVMYPAMVRTFRGAGAQFATMFAYDMLATAPYNLGWQTHFLNLVHSPGKALGAVIAAEAMRTLPRGERYGPYPANCDFGPFQVNASADLATMETADTFMNAGDSLDRPRDRANLRRVAGCGRSAVVDYEGTGAYFLDRVVDGVWRLEVYPDAVLVQDLFAQRLNHESISSRVIWQTWPMGVHLPDLGRTFAVEPVNVGNPHRARAVDGRFEVRPGVYQLVRDGAAAPEAPPAAIGAVGFAEFVCPPSHDLPVQVVPDVPVEAVAGSTVRWAVDVVHATLPDRVILHRRGEDGVESEALAMRRVRAYRWEAEAWMPKENVVWSVSIEHDESTKRFPDESDGAWTVRSVAPGAPLALFDPARDADRLFHPRIEGRPGGNATRVLPQLDRLPPRLRLAPPLDRDTVREIRVGVPVHETMAARGEGVAAARALRIRVVAEQRGEPLQIVLIEHDGTSWSVTLELEDTWRDFVIPVTAFQSGGGEKLPVGYPGRWNTSLPMPPGRGSPDDTVRLAQIEQIQFVHTPGRGASVKAGAIEVAGTELLFD